MNQPIKDWVRQALGPICQRNYQTISSETGDIKTPEGKLLKWAIRDSKPHEPWVFSITLAMSLSSFVKETSEEIAQRLAQGLTEKNCESWVFKGQGGYINVYFEPRHIEDYLVGKEPPNWEILKEMENGPYAYYRLHIILKALEVRGVSAEKTGLRPEFEGKIPNESEICKCPLNQHPLHELFNYPDMPVQASTASAEAWEKWLDTVVDMTRRGNLSSLDREMETLLMVFLKACLY